MIMATMSPIVLLAAKKPIVPPAITPIAMAPTTKLFLYAWWFMYSSLIITLALQIERDADDLLEFSQSMLAVHESREIFKLKSSPGPLRVNQI
jgi:hypothetical protein